MKKRYLLIGFATTTVLFSTCLKSEAIRIKEQQAKHQYAISQYDALEDAFVDAFVVDELSTMLFKDILNSDCVQVQAKVDGLYVSLQLRQVVYIPP